MYSAIPMLKSATASFKIPNPFQAFNHHMSIRWSISFFVFPLISGQLAWWGWVSNLISSIWKPLLYLCVCVSNFGTYSPPYYSHFLYF